VNEDTALILSNMSDIRNELTKAIGDLHSEFAGFKGGMDARVDQIEADQEKTEKRQWIHSVVVTVGTVLHHDLGAWLHWKI
jgi:hypothetical protein